MNNNDEKEWKNMIKSYEQNKKNLEWGSNPSPFIFSHKFIKETENIYNPITQKYNDKETENRIRKHEKQTKINNLARSFDKDLRYSQTYDLVSLDDKLKKFKDHPNYPHSINNDHLKLFEKSRVNYNILSNINLDKHSSLKPEDRIKYLNNNNDNENSNLNNNKIIQIKVNKNNYKDYNILTNNYKENNDQKQLIDKTYTLISAANNYWKKQDFDPVAVKFIDNTKEENFQKKREEKEKIQALNKRGNGKSLPYNLFNSSVIDKEKLEEMDKKELNKKQRFKLRYDIEGYYKERDKVNEERKKLLPETKISYNRYKIEDDRNFDIITLEKNRQVYKDNVKLKDQDPVWLKIEKEAKNLNKDVYVKEIIQKPENYLYSDRNDSYNMRGVFDSNNVKNQKRRKTQKNDSLPTLKVGMNADSFVKPNPYYLSNQLNNFDVNKGEWFSKQKDNNIEIKKVNNNNNNNNTKDNGYQFRYNDKIQSLFN